MLGAKVRLSGTRHSIIGKPKLVQSCTDLYVGLREYL